MKNQLLFSISILLLFCFGCGSTNSTSSTNNSSPSEKAFNSAIKNLSKGKSVAKNKELLKSSLSQIIQENQTATDSLSAKTDLASKEKIVSINDYLLGRIEKAKAYHPDFFMKKFNEVKKNKEEVSNFLQSEFLKIAQSELKEAMEKEDKSIARKACKSFENALKYGTDKTEMEASYNQSLSYAYTLYHLEATSIDDESYSTLVDERFKEFERTTRNSKKIFYKKVDPKNVDCKLAILLESFQIAKSDNKEMIPFEKDIYVVETVGGKQQKVLKRVSGTVERDIQIKKAYWDVKLDVESKSNECDLKPFTYREELELQVVNIRTSGDDRAIPDQYKNQGQENLPTDREIVEELLERIYKKIEYRIY